METKQITLRSQTVQCRNCGEYYSVTYKYCPFCEFGKPEPRKSGAKGKNSGLLGGLLGGQDTKSAGKRPASDSRKHRPEAANRKPHTGPEESVSLDDEAEGAPAKQESRPARRSGSAKRRAAGEEESRKNPLSGYAAWYSSPEYEATRKRSSGIRKKTSEMTAEEKAAYQAEREARAAERKRERDRLVRAAALEDASVPLSTPEAAEGGSAAVLIEQPAAVEPAAVSAPAEDAVPQTVQAEPDPASLENIPLFIPDDLPEAMPEVSVSGEDGTTEPAAEVPAAPSADQPVQDAAATAQPESAGVPFDRDLDSLLLEIHGLLSEDAPEEAAQDSTPAPVPGEVASEGQSLVQEAPLTAGELLASPSEEDITIDQILNEVRSGLLDTPAETAPVQTPSPIEAPAAEAVQPPAEPPIAEAVQPAAEETAADQPAPEESPLLPPEPQLLTEVSPAENTAAPAPEQEENPFLGLDQEVRQTDPALTKVFAPVAPEENAEPELLAVSSGKKQAEDAAESAQPPQKKANAAKAAGEKKKLPLIPIISVIVIIAALFILFHSVVPAFRSGALSGGETQADVVEDTAETFTLDQTELNFVEPDAKVTLSAIFEPEGSAAALKWTCSNWSVVFLDEDGTVTSVAPGDAIVTATMANGQSAQCEVHCTWDPNAPAASGGAAAAPSDGPALNSNDITLDGEGVSKTLEVTGASEVPKWASSNPSVATVDQSGVVTAVSKGSASVTATLGDKTLTCAVRCVW